MKQKALERIETVLSTAHFNSSQSFIAYIKSFRFDYMSSLGRIE
jgi:hypothetical protein